MATLFVFLRLVLNKCGTHVVRLGWYASSVLLGRQAGRVNVASTERSYYGQHCDLAVRMTIVHQGRCFYVISLTYLQK
jgi:hypothetical protein